jgi:hypothetical protein
MSSATLRGVEGPCVGVQLSAVGNHTEQQHAMQQGDLERRELTQIERREICEGKRDQQAEFGEAGPEPIPPGKDH